MALGLLPEGRVRVRVLVVKCRKKWLWVLKRVVTIAAYLPEDRDLAEWVARELSKYRMVYAGCWVESVDVEILSDEPEPDPAP